MHTLVGGLLQNLLDLLVGLSYIVLVLALDVQVELTTAHLRLLARLDENSTQGNGAIGLMLDSV